MSKSPLSATEPSILKNVAWGSAGMLVAKILRFFYLSVAIKAVGIEQWGYFAVAVAVVQLLQQIQDFGRPLYAATTRVDSETLDTSLFSSMVWGRWLLGGAALLVAAPVIRAGHLWHQAPVLFYALILLIRPFQIDWWMIRKGRSGILQWLQSAKLFFLVLILLIGKNWNIRELVALELASELLIAGMGWILFRRNLSLPRALKRKEEGRVLRATWRMFLAALFLQIHQNIDLLVLNHFRTAEEVGGYDTSFRFTWFLVNLLGIVLIAFRPHLNRRVEKFGYQEGRAMVNAIRMTLAPLSVFWIAAARLWGDKIMEIYGGAGAVFATPFLVYLALYLAVTTLALPSLEMVLARGQHKVFLFGAIGAGGLNLLLNLLVVPHYGGIGAALTTVIVELLLVVWFTWQSGAWDKNSIRFIAGFVATIAAVWGLTAPELFWGWRLLILPAVLSGTVLSGWKPRFIFSFLKERSTPAAVR